MTLRNLPPALLSVVWALFAWAFLLIVSQEISEPLHALVRGIGSVGFAPGIVVVSTQYDSAFFLLISAALASAHFVIFGRRTLSDVWATAASVLFAVGVAGAVGLGQPVLAVLSGVSAVFLIRADLRKVTEHDRYAARSALKHLLLLLIGALALLSLAADIRWVLGGFDGSVPLEGPSWQVPLTALRIIALLDPVLPELAVLALFAWVLRLVIPLDKTVAERSMARSLSGARGGIDQLSHWSQNKWTWAILVLAVVISVFVGIYCYLPANNPTSALVGVDVRYCYSHWLEGIQGNTLCGSAGFTISNERIGTLLLLKLLSYALGSADAALKAAPAILSVLLALSSYFLVREGTGDRFMAGVSALLAAVSPQVIAGTNAGSLANWLGVVVATFFFGYLLRSVRTGKKRHALIASVFFISLLAVHPWTWALTLGVCTVFLGLVLVQSGLRGALGPRKFETGLLTIIVIGGAIAFILMDVTHLWTGLPSVSFDVASALSLSNVFGLFGNVSLTLQTFLLGALADPIWFLLGAIGMITLPGARGKFGLLLVAWSAVVSGLAALVGDSGRIPQARVMVAFPIQILAAFGAVAVLNWAAILVRTSEGRSRGDSLLVVLFLAAVVGLFLGFALDNLGYLYRGAPGA